MLGNIDHSFMDLVTEVGQQRTMHMKDYERETLLIQAGRSMIKHSRSLMFLIILRTVSLVYYRP